MQRVIEIDLTGLDRPLRLHEDAYETLRQYLEQARARLGADPDAAEVVGDLERSIGERLAGLAGPDDRVLGAADIAAVLDAVGAVEVDAQAASTTGAAAAAGAGAGASTTGAPNDPAATTAPQAAGTPTAARTPTAAGTPTRRRLYRIREGQNIAGVCTGVAAYSDLDIGMVRAIFVLLAIFSGGLFLLVYLALMFILPVAATREEWLAAMAQA